MRDALGVDIGGVIIAQARGSSDESFSSERYLETPALPGALEALHALIEKRFGDRVYLVSKRGPRTQAKTRRWLKHHQFCARTGIPPRHVHFCLDREEKAGICRRLGVTHFIDNRLDVLTYLRAVTHRFLFQPPGSEVVTDRVLRVPPSIRIVASWQEILADLVSSERR